MEKSTVSYFEQKFGAYDAEELSDLVSRRPDLSDDAIEALELVLAAKGLNASDLFAAPQTELLNNPDEEVKQVADQTRSARELWRGGLSTTCKFLVAFNFIAPVQVFLQSSTVGGLWAGLMVLAAGYAGHSVGHSITRTICSNADISVQAKKRNLWIMFAVLWPIYFLVYGVSDATIGRG